jgi:hypothetical protein
MRSPEGAERVSLFRQGTGAIFVSRRLDWCHRRHCLGDDCRLQAAYRLAQVGARPLDAAGAHADLGCELEHRNGVGSGSCQQFGRVRHSIFCPSLSHGPVWLYRDWRYVLLCFGSTHCFRLFDLALEIVAEATTAGIERGSSRLIHTFTVAFATLGFHFPDSAEAGIHGAGVGQSELFAMTGKVITLEFVLPTLLAIVLGILLSIGAVYLADRYLGSVIDLLI